MTEYTQPEVVESMLTWAILILAAAALYLDSPQ